MDKEDVCLKIETLKAEGKKPAYFLTDEEWDVVYSFPRPTPERLAAYRAKAKITRQARREENERLAKSVERDFDTQLDELVPIALLTLHDAMHDPQVGNRLKAAVEVLNRRFGRPKQAIEMNEKKPEEIVYQSTVLDAMKEGEVASRN